MTTPPTIPGTLLFISGPSGVGKSTICRRLAAELPAQFAISATTRKAKPQDAFGKKYLFVNETEFRRLLEANEFLEYAEVFGNLYGTLKRPVEDALAAGRIVLLEIDVQGAMQVAKIFPHAVGVFILPPSEDALVDRLRSRQRDSEQEIFRRLTEAQQEIRTAKVSGVFPIQVVNSDLELALAEIKSALAAFKNKQKGA